MNLRRYKEYLSKNKDDGFTLMELLVVMAIISILGITVWMGFAAAVNLIHAVPVTTKMIHQFIGLDSVLREFISRVRPPFWEPELEIELDSMSAIFPFYDGIKEQYLQIDFYDNYIYIKTFNEENLDEVTTHYSSGPFMYVYFSEVTEKPEGLIGLEITCKPEHEKIDEFKIFARFGGFVFLKP